jgi:hypothetical protein
MSHLVWLAVGSGNEKENVACRGCNIDIARLSILQHLYLEADVCSRISYVVLEMAAAPPKSIFGLSNCTDGKVQWRLTLNIFAF